MLTDCRLPLLAVMLCLLDSGCISVRYGDRDLPLEPTPAMRPASCASVLEPAPAAMELPPQEERPCDESLLAEPAPQGSPLTEIPPEQLPCVSLKPWHSRLHAALPRFWRFHREPPPVAPVIPPRPRFHPVPTRPPFARQVIFETVPPLVPPAVDDSQPEAIDTPPIEPPAMEPEPTAGPTGTVPLDAEAGEAPRPLTDELRVASPISPRVPTQAR